MTAELAHQTRAGDAKSVTFTFAIPGKSSCTSVSAATTAFGVDGVGCTACDWRRIVFVAWAATSVSPATTTTCAEPSGQRERTEEASVGSSGDVTSVPSGTDPSSG